MIKLPSSHSDISVTCLRTLSLPFHFKFVNQGENTVAFDWVTFSFHAD